MGRCARLHARELRHAEEARTGLTDATALVAAGLMPAHAVALVEAAALRSRPAAPPDSLDPAIAANAAVDDNVLVTELVLFLAPVRAFRVRAQGRSVVAARRLSARLAAHLPRSGAGTCAGDAIAAWPVRLDADERPARGGTYLLSTRGLCCSWTQHAPRDEGANADTDRPPPGDRARERAGELVKEVIAQRVTGGCFAVLRQPPTAVEDHLSQIALATLRHPSPRMEIDQPGSVERVDPAFQASSLAGHELRIAQSVCE
jgi:hypothetical protein